MAIMYKLMALKRAPDLSVCRDHDACHPPINVDDAPLRPINILGLLRGVLLGLIRGVSLLLGLLRGVRRFLWAAGLLD